MKHYKVIERIRSNIYSRSELVKLRINAELMFKNGDIDAKLVLEEIDIASPTDKFMIFMGFCPSADPSLRLDLEWKEKGICTFIHFNSKAQLQRFNNIWPGDLIILKKRQLIGKTMQLFGYGRVTGVKFDDEKNRYLEMNWSCQDQIIEVPLMGCNSTVNIKTIEQVEAEMLTEFYSWLGYGKSSTNYPISNLKI